MKTCLSEGELYLIGGLIEIITLENIMHNLNKFKLIETKGCTFSQIMTHDKNNLHFSEFQHK